MMGSVNYMTTIIQMRAPGMTMFRLPMTIWAMFITAVLQAFALPVLTAALFMQLLDRTARHRLLHARRLDRSPTRVPAAGGGQPLLWQHLFWFYSHPAVYIMILPAMGMVSDIISCFSRKPLFGYKPMVYSIAGIAGLGFIVWGHHMFMSRHEPGPGHDVHGLDDDDRPAHRRSRSSTGWARCGAAGSSSPRRCSSPWRSCRCSSSAGCRASSWRPRRSTSSSTTPISSSAHFHYVLFGGTAMGVFGGDLFLVPQDVRPDDERVLGQDPLLPHVHLLQRHVLPDAHSGSGRLPAPLCRSVSLSRRSPICSR